MAVGRKLPAGLMGADMSNAILSLADACEKPLRLLTRVMFLISLAILAFMPVPIIADIAGRELAGVAVPGVIELEELCMVLLLFLALPTAEITKTHIAIDFLTKKFPDWVNETLDTAYSVITAGFLFIAGYWAWQQAILKSANTSAELFIPITPFLMLVGVSMYITACIAIVKGFRALGALMSRGRGFLGVVAILAGLLIVTIPWWFPILGIKLDRSVLGVSGWLAMLLLLFLRLPLAYSMGVIGMVGLCLVSKTNASGLAMVGIAPYNAMISFVLVSVPLFVLMGEITSKSGISRDLFEAASIWLGRMPGGLAISAIAGCAGFAAICGESLPTAVTMSSVALPEMQRLHYDDSLASGALAAGGTLGILIPPSIGFIFYSVVTEQSVGMLFMAGIFPGLILTLLFIISILFTTIRDPSKGPAGGKSTWAQRWSSLRKVIGFAIIFLIIIVGIMTGLMNPTEASGIGCAGALLVAVGRRRLSLTQFIHSLEDTMRISSRLLFILAGVGILGFFLALTHLPTNLGEWIVDLGLSRYATLFIIICIWVALGCVMNVIPMILLTLPALFPTIEMLEFDPIWFGVIAVIVMEMGQLTPPVGIVCFAVSSVGGVPLEKVFKGVLPFFISMWIVVILVIIFPGIATWLPNYLFR